MVMTTAALIYTSNDVISRNEGERVAENQTRSDNDWTMLIMNRNKLKTKAQIRHQIGYTVIGWPRSPWASVKLLARRRQSSSDLPESTHSLSPQVALQKYRPLINRYYPYDEKSIS